MSAIRVMLPLLSMLLVWALSQAPIFRQLDMWVEDRQQALFADEHYFRDVLVLDIDDATLLDLKPEFGVWPYDRDLYALMLDYLSGMGVETVVFDILFAEERGGDRHLAESLARHRNAVFAAAAPAFIDDVDYNSVQYRSLLQRSGWEVASDTPADTMPMVLLPVPAFIQPRRSGSNVGVVNISVDGDGIVRRIPSLYKVGEQFLPSLPLAAQPLRSSGSGVRYIGESGRLMLDGNGWPVDDRGGLRLYFPRNANSVLSLSFHKVVQAARGRIDPVEAKALLAGKTVFIGSTAFKSDKVNTPRGMMSGTYLQAIAYENLKQGLILKPNNIAVDLLWIASALLLSLWMGMSGRYRPSRYALYSLAAGGAILVGNGLVLRYVQQPSVLLFPMSLLFSGYVLYILFFGLFINRHNRQLEMQKQALQREYAELESEANQDALTRLYNRRAFLRLFERERERSILTGERFSVAIMDLDHFKSINDRYGHATGDEVLQTFAALLKSSIRKGDVAARWGGEEFVALLPGSDGGQALQVMEKIRLEVHERILSSAEGAFRVSVSIGVAQYGDIAPTAESVVACADKALYEAKSKGRNRVCLYDLCGDEYDE